MHTDVYVAKGAATIATVASGVSWLSGQTAGSFLFVGISIAASTWAWWIARQEREAQRNDRIRQMERDQRHMLTLQAMAANHIEMGAMVARLVAALDANTKEK